MLLWHEWAPVKVWCHLLKVDVIVHPLLCNPSLVLYFVVIDLFLLPSGMMFIYLTCERWCKHAVITFASTRPCYITVIICDVMLCVRERCVCECEKSSVLRVFGPRPWGSPRNVIVKSDSLHFTPQPTLTSCSALQRSPFPWWSCNPLDPFLMESWLCLYTDVLSTGIWVKRWHICPNFILRLSLYVLLWDKHRSSVKFLLFSSEWNAVITSGTDTSVRVFHQEIVEKIFVLLYTIICWAICAVAFWVNACTIPFKAE